MAVFEPSILAQAADGIAAESLGAVAAAAGRVFGSAFDAEVFSDEEYAHLVRRHCRIATPENSFKFARLRRIEGRADFSVSDRILAFAREAGMPVHGHTLIWNDWNPPWVKALSADRCAYWLERHIDEVAGHYAGKIFAWDVVNEPFNMYFQKPGDFRDGPWYASMGPDYVRRSFIAAAKADPHAKLALNEAFTEYDDEFGRRTRAALLRLLDQLKNQGARVDVVGLQGHLNPRRRWNAEAFAGFLDNLAAREVEIYITELDCDDSSLAADERVRDSEVAGIFQGFLGTALSEPAISTVITWQLSDRYTFYRYDKQGRGVRAARTLPFDKALTPKPAYAAFVREFKQHPRPG